MSKDSSLREEISAYLGRKRTKVLDNLSQEDWEKLKNLEVSPTKSYFIKGSRSSLKKFEAYFLFLCAYNKPLYHKYLITEYAERLSKPATDALDDLIGVDKELIILYMHNVQVGVGNSVNWLVTTVLNKVANRNREGNVTIILSERDFIPFQDSKELINIDLGGATRSVQVEDALKNDSQSTGGMDKGIIKSMNSLTNKDFS